MRVPSILFAACALVAGTPSHAAVVDVQVRNFRYVPNDITITAGDTVRWTNVEGVHNVSADDGSFRNAIAGNPWVFNREFTEPGVVRYFCEVHSAPGLDINNAMNGRITVLAPQAPPFAINRGISGAWFNPPTSGQGFLLDVDPATQVMFVAWFTYERVATAADGKVGAPDNRWLTAQGNYNGNVATMQLFRTTGGRFDQGGGTATTNVGTLTITFDSCTAGNARYAITTDGGLAGTIPIQRVLPGTEADCNARTTNAGTSLPR